MKSIDRCLNCEHFSGITYDLPIGMNIPICHVNGTDPSEKNYPNKEKGCKYFKKIWWKFWIKDNSCIK